MPDPIVAYYRVSTDGQAVRGLSLPAQRDLVHAHAAASDGCIIEEFTEVESAYRPGRITFQSRPCLEAAIKSCRKHKATLVIAALDRLARNVVFIASLVESRVRFLALDIPNATPFMLHIYAAVAEEESREKSDLLRAAIAIARSRGVEWALGPKRRAAAARQHAETMRPVVADIRAEGIRGPTRLANELNKRGFVSSRGSPWSTQSARTLLQYLGCYERPAVPWSEISKKEARQFNFTFAATVAAMRADGCASYSEVAIRLNQRALTTVRGLVWSSKRVEHVARRARFYRRQGRERDPN